MGTFPHLICDNFPCISDHFQTNIDIGTHNFGKMYNFIGLTASAVKRDLLLAV